jgi:dTDP-glucose 4,6-dehydratase
MKRILLTGAGGFIGFHCLKYFLDNTDWFVVCLDSFKHKGRYSRLSEINLDQEQQNRVEIFKHDLTVPIDEALENKILAKKISPNGEVYSSEIDMIINMASDSAVERSLSDPGQCWKNNCDLIYNMLEFSRRVKPRVFFQVSTDEVYGDCPENYCHPEWDVIIPSNPYSASKAAQEALAISYFRTFDVPLVITNTMNTIGTCQDKEKFLPKVIWKIATNQTMEIYADKAIDKDEVKIGTRFYLHAENHADVFLFLANKPVSLFKNGALKPDRYNVVGDIELNNLELAQLIAKIMGKELKYELVFSDKIRPGYDKRYALNGSKLKDMGWKPPVDFLEGLEKIVKWTLDHPWWI